MSEKMIPIFSFLIPKRDVPISIPREMAESVQ